MPRSRSRRSGTLCHSPDSAVGATACTTGNPWTAWTRRSVHSHRMWHGWASHTAPRRRSQHRSPQTRCRRSAQRGRAKRWSCWRWTLRAHGTRPSRRHEEQVRQGHESVVGDGQVHQDQGVAAVTSGKKTGSVGTLQRKPYKQIRARREDHAEDERNDQAPRDEQRHRAHELCCGWR